MELRSLALLTGLVALLAACSDQSVLAPATLPAGAVPMVAPETYARWWADTEKCSGRAGTLRRVNWFVVPNAGYFTYDGEDYDGFWFRYHHQIILASAHMQDSSVVRHEMLHDLLNDGSHPSEYFSRRCGGVVAEKLAAQDGELR